MKTALIISSFVSASNVGATASTFCLRRLGIETAVLPTTLFGRHPGWGAPGGVKTPPDLLRDMWDGIKAQNIRFDAVMTGYMGDIDHVALAADIIAHVKEENPEAHILVDPVMGDHGRLYISEGIATAIKDTLVPLADTITPNCWELEFITGLSAQSLQNAEAAAAALPCATIVTSVEEESQIGALYYHGAKNLYISHKKFTEVPNGGGDSLAGTFLAHILNNVAETDAIARATASIFAIITAANDEDLGELPLVRLQDALTAAPPLPIRKPPYD
ncbi:PfkB family carbohydrate kinase [Fretibacter rubidus]|uniref:PfkB family carbohydrate kinase n=1 Tax=Fretibacter rubidus TaxID=570162 RepID=UPI00352B8F91